jgi:hypothetical protein
MKKIPSFFIRKTGSSLANVECVNAECSWVLDANVPMRVTVKRDGTPMLLMDRQWYQRRVIKTGNGGVIERPDGFHPAQPAAGYDQENGQWEWPGWVPLSAQYKPYLEEAGYADISVEGTYELCGPKINGNPERLKKHTLFWHGSEEISLSPLLTRSKDLVIDIVKLTRHEGVVLYANDGRMAKARRREFGFDWPIGN